ncbi:unnamed protein product [Tuber melanosporum]|uniref:(Perigord truffle) hypothetical protein n=1 Tax=Tuber melanosporum (strain Mel28) TaxID=656061 RepID=D5GCW1_TUBMM|nr:uncharacterized protein GSTUM_00000805001 [Tuber melanosporum]CAZ82354.1 unnamed protein product [Tuber melanosporum]
MPWFVFSTPGGAWVALREHWFHLTQETGSDMMVGNLTVLSGRSQIGSASIPIRIPCCQAHSDYLLGELAGWSPWNWLVP